jgi:FHA domain
MAEEMYLVIHLASGQAGAEAAANAVPLLLSRKPNGVLEDSSLSPALKNSVVVYNGPVGWVACDRHSEEVKTLAKDVWADLGGWRMKVIEQKEKPPESAGSSVIEHSIVNNSDFLTPFLLVYDSVHQGQPPKRETLPIREGVERLLGRARAEGRIVLDDRRVSRDHLRFYVEGGAIHVENLSQYPPTLELNGESTRITGRVKLVHKARIKIGQSHVEFFNPIDVVPAGKGKDSKSNVAIQSTPAAAALGAAPPAAGSTASAEASSETIEQEGYDWVEKTLMVIAALLVVFLAYMLFDSFGSG